MSIDKAGWGQVLVGALALLLSVGGTFMTLSSGQAEAHVKIERLESRVEKALDYDYYVQEQIDNQKERLIVAETTLKIVKEETSEINDNIKLLVREIQKLTAKVIVIETTQDREK